MSGKMHTSQIENDHLRRGRLAFAGVADAVSELRAHLIVLRHGEKERQVALLAGARALQSCAKRAE